MNKVIIDFLNDFIKTPYTDDMEKKYWRNLPDVSIKETVRYILDNKLEVKFIDTKFYGDFRDKQAPYLLKIDNGNYEVFDSERGAKHGIKTYSSIDKALFYYLDKIYNSYAVAASDSVINS